MRSVPADEPRHGERCERPRASGARGCGLAIARSLRSAVAELFEDVLGTGAHEPAVDQLAERLVRHVERDREGDDRAALDAADGAGGHQREREDESERAEHLARV